MITWARVAIMINLRVDFIMVPTHQHLLVHTGVAQTGPPSIASNHNLDSIFKTQYCLRAHAADIGETLALELNVTCTYWIGKFGTRGEVTPIGCCTHNCDATITLWSFAAV